MSRLRRLHIPKLTVSGLLEQAREHFAEFGRLLRVTAAIWAVRPPVTPDAELRAGLASLKPSPWCVNPTPVPPSFEETYALPR